MVKQDLWQYLTSIPDLFEYAAMLRSNEIKSFKENCDINSVSVLSKNNTYLVDVVWPNKF